MPATYSWTLADRTPSWSCAAADDREPRAETRHAVGEREDDDEQHVLGERGAPGVVREGVDRPLERPRDRQRGERRGPEAGDTHAVADPVARDVPPDGARRRRQPRLPAACGLSAA